jgi:pentose-5-phosphate-3-epimerase
MVKIKDRIVPSNPFKTYGDIEDLAGKCRGELKRIQIDLCDGKYVGSVSWPFTEMSKPEFAQIGGDDKADVYLPLWESINYTADVMCEKPDSYIDSLIAYGFDEIILHFRSLDKQTFPEIIEKAKLAELSLVLAVDTQTDLEEFILFATKHIEDIHGFQVMGIEKIGFQKQSFSLRSLEIVKTLKEKFEDKKILLDGGISDETILACKEAGVDQFCVGSYLSEATNFLENLATLKGLLRDVI